MASPAGDGRSAFGAAREGEREHGGPAVREREVHGGGGGQQPDRSLLAGRRIWPAALAPR